MQTYTKLGLKLIQGRGGSAEVLQILLLSLIDVQTNSWISEHE